MQIDRLESGEMKQVEMEYIQAKESGKPRNTGRTVPTPLIRALTSSISYSFPAVYPRNASLTVASIVDQVESGLLNFGSEVSTS